jgi:hypothetical protein
MNIVLIHVICLGEENMLVPSFQSSTTNTKHLDPFMKSKPYSTHRSDFDLQTVPPRIRQGRRRHMKFEMKIACGKGGAD